MSIKASMTREQYYSETEGKRVSERGYGSRKREKGAERGIKEVRKKDRETDIERRASLCFARPCENGETSRSIVLTGPRGCNLIPSGTRAGGVNVRCWLLKLAVTERRSTVACHSRLDIYFGDDYAIRSR